MVFNWNSVTDHQLLLALLSESIHPKTGTEIRLTIKYKTIACLIGSGCTAATVQERVEKLQKIALSNASRSKPLAPSTGQVQSKAIHIDLSAPGAQQEGPKPVQLPSPAPSVTPEKRETESPNQKLVTKREATEEPLSISKKPRLGGTSDVKSEIPSVEVDKSSLEVIKKVCAENAALEQIIVNQDEEIRKLKAKIEELGEEITKLVQDGKQIADALIAERQGLETKLKTSQQSMKAQLEKTKGLQKEVIDVNEKINKLGERNALLRAKERATMELLDALHGLEGRGRKMQAFTGKAKNLPPVLEK